MSFKHSEHENEINTPNIHGFGTEQFSITSQSSLDTFATPATIESSLMASSSTMAFDTVMVPSSPNPGENGRQTEELDVEDDLLASGQILVSTHSGKPVFARFTDVMKTASVAGIIATIVAFFRSGYGDNMDHDVDHAHGDDNDSPTSNTRPGPVLSPRSRTSSRKRKDSTKSNGDTTPQLPRELRELVWGVDVQETINNRHGNTHRHIPSIGKRKVKRRLVFLIRPPLYLVGVVPQDNETLQSTPSLHTRRLLAQLHSTIIAQLTQTQLHRIFQDHPNHDLRHLLSGTEKLLKTVADLYESVLPSMFLGAVPMLRLPTHLRLRLHKVVEGVSKSFSTTGTKQTRNKQLQDKQPMQPPAHVLLLTKTHVLYANPPLHHSDIHILLSLLQSSSFSPEPTFLPLCLPHLNASAFHHLYISTLKPAPLYPPSPTPPLAFGSDSRPGSPVQPIHTLPRRKSHHKELTKSVLSRDVSSTSVTSTSQTSSTTNASNTITVVLVARSIHDFYDEHAYRTQLESELRSSHLLTGLEAALRIDPWCVIECGLPLLRHLVVVKRAGAQEDVKKTMRAFKKLSVSFSGTVSSSKLVTSDVQETRDDDLVEEDEVNWDGDLKTQRTCNWTAFGGVYREPHEQKRLMQLYKHLHATLQKLHRLQHPKQPKPPLPQFTTNTSSSPNPTSSSLSTMTIPLFMPCETVVVNRTPTHDYYMALEPVIEREKVSEVVETVAAWVRRRVGEFG